jgi:hypothetical protein
MAVTTVVPTVTVPVTQPGHQNLEKPCDYSAAVTVAPAGSLTSETQALPTGVTVRERRGGVDIAAYRAGRRPRRRRGRLLDQGDGAAVPRAPTLIVAMAVAMEASKLVTAGWLARRWRSTAWVARLALMTFVLGLATINGVGVFSQLVAAHVGERGERESYVTTQTADLDARIEVASHNVADIDARVSQIDSAVSAATRRGRTAGAMSIMDAQRRTRAGLTSEREQAAGTLAALKAERASVAARSRQAEIEAAPIHYVEELVGSSTGAPGEDERAIRWLIALMVLCCDPLAIALNGHGFSTAIDRLISRERVPAAEGPVSSRPFSVCPLARPNS